MFDNMQTVCLKTCIVFVLAALTLATVTAREESRTDFVAIVDNRHLRSTELDQRVDKILMTKELEVPADEDNKAFRRYTEGKIVGNWVNISLLAAEAEQRGFSVSQEGLDENLEKLREEYAPNLDISVALQRAGYTRDEYMNEMRDALLGEKLIHNYVSKKYSTQQLEEIYKKNRSNFIKPPQVHVLHIFKSLNTPESGQKKKDVRKSLQELRKRAKKGEDFRELAKHSDALSRSKGGDLGWLSPSNRLPEPINALVFKVKPGKVSKVVEDDKGYGYHLIKVLDKKPASGLTFEDARQDVEVYLFEQTKETLLQQLKQKHRVIINLNGIPESIAFQD